MKKIRGCLSVIFFLAGGVVFAAESPRAFSAGSLTLIADSSWVAVKPSSAMRAAQFEIPAAAGDTEKAELTVFYFAQGQGGDLDSNLKRWASQFETANSKPTPVIEKKTIAGMPVTLLSIEGTYQGAMGMAADSQAPKPSRAFIGAVMEAPGGNLFFKMLGSKATIEAARPALLQTLASAQAKASGEPASAQ